MNVFLKSSGKGGKRLWCLLMVLALGSVLSAQTWVELTPASPNGAPPDPYYGYKRVSYDPATNRLIVFYPGKECCGGFGNQVWVLTNANGLGGTPEWIRVYPIGSPSASNGGESVVYDPATNRLIVYGGCYMNCGYVLWDVFVLEGANGVGDSTWLQTPTVPWQNNRAGHSSVFDPTSNQMICFGGGNASWCPGCNYNDTRILTNANGLGGSSAWVTLAPTGGLPGVRTEHTAVYDPAHNRMVIFGGTWLYRNWYDSSHGHYIYDQRDYNDVWVLSDANGIGTPAWTQLSPAGVPPALRSSHSSVYDPLHNRMIVFGGSTFTFADQTSTPQGDVWQLSNANGLGGVPTWTELFPSGTAPGPRSMHTAAFDADHQRMIVFGGRNDSVTPQTCNRVWVLVFNTAPVADDQTVNADGGVALNIDLTASDEDDDELNYTVVAGPSHGVLTGSGSNLIYTALASYWGPDEFTFQANDGTADSNVATVTIAVNHVPVAAGQSVSTDENASAAISLGAAMDVDGDTLIYTVLSGPSHGILTGSGPNLTYGPTTYYSGTDSFTFQIGDGKTSSNIATILINVKRVFAFSGFAQPVDNMPVVNNAKAGSVIPVKWRITDLDGTPISDPSSFNNVASYNISCEALTGDPTDEVEAYAGTSGLQYIGDGNWQLNWKTPKTYLNQCRTMVLTLADGSTHTAYFKFK